MTCPTAHSRVLVAIALTLAGAVAAACGLDIKGTAPPAVDQEPTQPEPMNTGSFQSPGDVTLADAAAVEESDASQSEGDASEIVEAGGPIGPLCKPKGAKCEFSSECCGHDCDWDHGTRKCD